MSTERILIHGSTAQRMSTVPELGQVGSDDDEGRVYLGDGATQGGIGMARRDELPSNERILPSPDQEGADVGKVPVVVQGGGYELQEQTGGGSAEEITYDNTATGLVAESVQGAIDEVAAKVANTTQSFAANTQLTLAHRGHLINVDAQAAARIITLPAAETAGDGYVVTVRNSNAANFVTVAASGAELIDGVTSFKLTLTGHLAVFRCNGLSWNIISEAGTVETGQNINGKFTKYADGRLTCIGSGPGIATTIAQGALFVGDETWTLPHVATGVDSVAFARIQYASRVVNTRAVTTASVIVRQYSTVNDATVSAATIEFSGRWFN